MAYHTQQTLEVSFERTTVVNRLQTWRLDPVICVGEEAIFLPAQKCSYHVTFDLDLEHTLYARWPGVHRVQIWWRSGHLPARIDGGCKFTRIQYIVYIVDKLTAIHRAAAIAGGRSNNTLKLDTSRTQHSAGMPRDIPTEMDVTY